MRYFWVTIATSIKLVQKYASKKQDEDEKRDSKSFMLLNRS